ncbi:hypothetical protein [Coleofasciculus sp. H7-2]|uniref:hypothetical protein n=1 Tax=Coleofasciculus sp. H7-2 TaxID=3351545 RepID=UPI00366EE904
MLEKLMVAATLTFSLNVFLGHSWSAPQMASELNLQETASQIVSLLPRPNTHTPENSSGSNSVR